MSQGNRDLVSMAPMLEILQSVDPAFREIPHQADTRKTTRYSNDRDFRIEFLTPNRGSDDLQDKPCKMPALGGASTHQAETPARTGILNARTL